MNWQNVSDVRSFSAAAFEGGEKENRFVGLDAVQDRNFGGVLSLEPGFVAKVFHLNRKRFHRCPQIAKNQFVKFFVMFCAKFIELGLRGLFPGSDSGFR